MTVITPKQRAVFQHYVSREYRRHSAVTPVERLEVLAQLEQLLHTQGTLPTEQAVISVPVAHPAIQATLAGQPVSIGGTVVGVRRTWQERAQELDVRQKIAILFGVGVGIVLIFSLLTGALRRGAEPQTSTASLPPATATAPATPLPTVIPSVTVAPATPTVYSIALLTGNAASQVYDPASIEIGGYSYVLSMGQVRNGEWQPTGAEWLSGTHLRRVIAIPFETDVAHMVSTLVPGTVMHLRLRNGEVVSYKMLAVERVPRQQIEVMVDRQPSIAVILHGEPTPDRWVVIGEAIQAATATTDETAFLSPGPADSSPEVTTTVPVTITPPLSTTPTIVVTTVAPVSSHETVVITETLPLDHFAAGLRLEVSQCQRLDRIGEQTPPQNRQQFVTCTVTLTALDSNTAPVPYTAEAFALTEERWMTDSTDWWPSGVSVSGTLRSGTLNPGSRTGGRIGGVVNRNSSGIGGASSQPVLVWEQSGTRFLVRLTETAWN